MKTQATLSQPSAVPGSPLLQVSGALFGIIAFILIAAWLAKRVGLAGKTAGTRGLKVSASTTLGPRERVVIVEVENHGRDIFPTVQLVNSGVLDPYDMLLKLHTKRSPWREEHAELEGTGEAWKERFLSDLVGSRERVEEILNAFASDTSLGLMTADETIVGKEFWGGDQRIVEQLMRRIEMSVDPEALRFASGSMYWVRGFVLQGLRSFNLQAADFDEEAGQIDGTTAHAVERIIGIVTEEAGQHLAEVHELEALGADGVGGAGDGGVGVGDGGSGGVGAGAGAGAGDGGSGGGAEKDAWHHFDRDAARHPRAQVIPFRNQAITPVASANQDNDAPLLQQYFS